MISNKRGEWYARDWIIAVLLFSGVMVLLFIISTDSLVVYGRSDLVDYDFYQKYDRFQNTTGNIQSMYDSTAGEEGLNPVSFGELVAKSSFTVIALVFSSLGVFNSQIKNISTDLGVPNEIAFIIGPLLFGIIVVSIIFIIITSTSRNKI